MVGEPSEIEKKLADKGKDLSFSEAAVRLDFWYMAITSMIVIGTSRLFDENAETLGMHIESQEEMIQETYGVFEVIGAVVMGTLLTLFRSKLSPSSMVVLLTLLAGLGQFAMVWPSEVTSTEPMRVAVSTAAFAEGGFLVAIASLCHEEYGTENFGILFGTMLSFGAVGLYGFDEIFFPNIFSWYATENAAGVHYFKSYGKWNEFLFTCLAGAYGVVFLLSIVSHISIRAIERAKKDELVMVNF